jgi:hypothetical protein
MTRASLQERIELESVERDVVRFGSGERVHRLAVLAGTSLDQSLAHADEAKQEELLAGRARFLNAQLDDFQVLVRAEPVDLAGHLERIQQQTVGQTDTIVRIAHDYITFVRALARQRTLLERRCYVILPMPRRAAHPPGADVVAALQRLLGRRADRSDAMPLESDVAHQLTARCDGVARDLARSGLETVRMTGLAYAQLYHRCWSPEQARSQRLQRELDDYTTLVVGASQPVAGEDPDRHRGPRDRSASATQPRALSADERLLALGTRTLADLVAPGACEVRSDHLQLDGQYACVLVVTAYPRTVSPGWLAPLVESDLPIELSLHVRPLQSADTVRWLGHHIARLQASRMSALRDERVADPEREIALEDAERLRERLQRGDERVFSVSLYILVRASSRRELDELARRVETQLDGMLAHSRRARWEQEPGFRGCLPEGRDQLQVARNLDTSALACTLPFVGSSLSMERGVLYGISARTQEPIIVDPFDDSFDNYHLAVIAPTGSGKSYFVKLMALRNLMTRVDYLVVDPEDEYRRLADEVGGQIVRLAPSSRQQLNPLDLVLPDDADELGGPEGALAEAVATVATRLELLLCAATGDGGAPGLLDVYERAVLTRALHSAYAAAGITADAVADGRPAPLLSALHAALERTDGDVAARLALRLERHARAGLFAGPTSVRLDSSLVVFQIRDLPQELWPLAIHWIGGHVWNVARRERRPRRLVVDEAATLLAHPSGGAFLAEVARRARKHYLGLVTLTQKVADLTDCEHGDTILTNAAMKLLLKQTAEIVDAADRRFRFTWEERRWLLGAGKGEGLLVAGAQRHPIRIVASRAENLLITTNPRELAELTAAEAADGPPSVRSVLAGSRPAARRNGAPRAVAEPR